jgi:hypothetical protein
MPAIQAKIRPAEKGKTQPPCRTSQSAAGSACFPADVRKYSLHRAAPLLSAGNISAPAPVIPPNATPPNFPSAMKSKPKKPKTPPATAAAVPGSHPELFPLCDGQPAPPADAADEIDRRMHDFAAAYHLINVACERLRRIRTGESAEPAEAALAEIDEATRSRDALEDRYVAEGFYAEPLVEGLFVVDLVFNHARKKNSPTAAGVSAASEVLSSFSLYLPMGNPMEFEELLAQQLQMLFEDMKAAIFEEGAGTAQPMRQPKKKPQMKQKPQSSGSAAAKGKLPAARRKKAAEPGAAKGGKSSSSRSSKRK